MRVLKSVYCLIFMLFFISVSYQTSYAKEFTSVRVNDIKIAYKQFGDSEPIEHILMIMGYGCSMQMWQPKILKALANDFRVTVFDNRGMGYSTSSDKPYSIELFASDTVELMNVLKIDKTHLIGWSMGGFIAQEIAVNHPDRVEKLILLATSCGGKDALWPGDDRWQSLVDISGTMEERVNRMFSNLFTPNWLQENQDPSALFPAVSAPVNDANILRQAQTLKKWQGVCSRLDKIKADTLLMTGADDEVIPPQNSFITASAIYGSSVIQFKNAAHGFFYQYPEETALCISIFIGRLGTLVK